MKVHEAKQMAREWLRRQAPNVPQYAGALLTGSVHWLADGAHWPATSDVDIHILQETDTPLVHRKVPFGDIVVEASYRSTKEYRDTERLLGNPYVPHLMHPCVMDDPHGWLVDMQRQVGADYGKPVWLGKRINWVADNAHGKLTNARDKIGTLTRMLQFVLGIRNIAAIPAVAAKVNPTGRRCLVLSGRLLGEAGAERLQEAMLEALCGPDLSAEMVGRHIEQIEALFDPASAVLKTPFWGDFDMDPCVKTIAIEGSRELVTAGRHREAEYFVLLMLYFCHRALANDAPADDKPRYREMLDGTLNDVGLGTPEAFGRRSEQALEVLDAVKARVLGYSGLADGTA